MIVVLICSVIVREDLSFITLFPLPSATFELCYQQDADLSADEEGAVPDSSDPTNGTPEDPDDWPCNERELPVILETDLDDSQFEEVMSFADHKHNLVGVRPGSIHETALSQLYSFNSLERLNRLRI
jgi:hypothetical protein